MAVARADWILSTPQPRDHAFDSTPAAPAPSSSAGSPRLVTCAAVKRAFHSLVTLSRNAVA